MVKSAGRAIGVFELMAKLRRPVRVREVSEFIQAPQSSVSVLLSSLERQGFLDYDPQERTYAPTMRLAMLGHGFHEYLLSSVGLLARLDALATYTAGTVVVAVMHESRAYFLHVQAPEPGFPALAGTSESLFDSAVGAAFLAHEEWRRVERLANSYNLAAQAQGRVGLPLLRLSLAAFAEQGYADVPAGLSGQWASVAAMAPRRPRDTPLAIGVFCRARDFPARRLCLIEGVLRVFDERSAEVRAQHWIPNA